MTFNSGYWVDPPEYFENCVWPCYLKYNAKLLKYVNEDMPYLVVDDDENTMGRVLFLNTDKLNIREMILKTMDFIQSEIEKRMAL